MKFRAAKYLRLSQEDRGKSSADDSESIENQSAIIDKYLRENPDIELYDTYIDDGFTGLNYERAAYKRMMRDIDAGLVNCIICKSLTRLGREHAETITLFKKDFVIKGIRFIAITDHIDFYGRDEGIEIPMKVMMNDYYSMKISQDVRAAQNVKRLKGEFIGSFACYGYVKDPNDKNHLLVDPVAAGVVKRIYAMCIAGYKIKAIATVLNEEGVLTPSDYKTQVQGFNYRNARKLGQTNYWTYTTINVILRNEMYVGNMVQGKHEKVAYNLDKMITHSKDELTVVENTHEGIISREDFDTVQKIFKTRFREMSLDNISPYVGLLYCGDCGRAMSKSNRKNGYLYRCGTYAKVGTKYCTGKHIHVDDLNAIMLSAINEYAMEALSLQDKTALKEACLNRNIQGDLDEIKSIKGRQEEMIREKQEMLLMLAKKVIAEEDFLLYNKQYALEKEKLEQQERVLLEKKRQNNQYMEELNQWIAHFLQYKNIKGINREVLVSLVDRIEVFDNKKVRIKFKFQKPT